MKVRMLTMYAGPLGTCDAGRMIDLPDLQAEELIRAKCAERVGRAPAKPKAEIDTATAEPDEERAVRTTAKKRRRSA